MPAMHSSTEGEIHGAADDKRNPDASESERDREQKARDQVADVVLAVQRDHRSEAGRGRDEVADLKCEEQVFERGAEKQDQDRSEKRQPVPDTTSEKDEKRHRAQKKESDREGKVRSRRAQSENSRAST